MVTNQKLKYKWNRTLLDRLPVTLWGWVCYWVNYHTMCPFVQDTAKPVVLGFFLVVVVWLHSSSVSLSLASFFSLLVVHVRWGSLKKPVYLHLRGSGPLHDETKIWRCNPNHRQPISPAFHKSLVKYDRLFLPRARALVFAVKTSGSESAFRNTWTLDVMKKLKPIKIPFSWISKRETSIIWEIQTFGECRVPAESMSGGNYSMSAPTCRSAVGKTLHGGSFSCAHTLIECTPPTILTGGKYPPHSVLCS